MFLDLWVEHGSDDCTAAYETFLILKLQRRGPEDSIASSDRWRPWNVVVKWTDAVVH